jgi:hypothetical protein
MTEPVELNERGEVTLPNGRRYRVRDTGQPFRDGEYPRGGLTVQLLHGNVWVYLETVREKADLELLFKGLARLAPLGEMRSAN